MFTSESNNTYFSNLEIRNKILEKGRECFTHWLSAEEGNGERNNYIQLSLKTFEKDSRILIHDNFHKIDIEVKFDNGVPVCSLCNNYDCTHIGFAICAEQNL
jgi:hypothetical protein